MPVPFLAFPLHHELRNPEQHALDLRVGESADGLARLVGELDRARIGGVDRAMAIQDGDDVGGRDAVEAAIAEHGFNRAALRRSAVLQRVQHGHRGFAFAQIAGDRLAQHLFRGGEVEHVVNNLKCHAEVAAVVGQPLLVGFAGAGENSAQLHADGKQAGGLAVDELEVFVHA